MKKLRVAVVGVGYLGKFHAEKYAGMEDVDLVGVVDIDTDRARTVAENNDTVAYGDHRELMGRIDAASVVVPTPLHFETGRDLLMNGVHVLVEKPITSTLEEADELIRLSGEKGLVLQVGHIERFNPAVSALGDIVTDPMFVESHRLSFYRERGIDVSVVFDLMIHDIDIILNFVKSEVSTVRAAGTSVLSDHVDIANARLEFENGCVANVTASRISMKNQRKIRLFQKNAYVAVDFAAKKITTIEHTGDKPQGILPIPGMKFKESSFTEGDALENELGSFVNAVSGKAECRVTGHAGRKALKVAFEVMEQIKRHKKRVDDFEARGV